MSEKPLYQKFSECLAELGTKKRKRETVKKDYNSEFRSYLMTKCARAALEDNEYDAEFDTTDAECHGVDVNYVIKLIDDLGLKIVGSNISDCTWTVSWAHLVEDE